MLAEAIARVSGNRVTLLRIVLFLAVVIYIPTLNFFFVYDDQPQIVMNERLNDWKYLPQYFTESTWGVSDVVYQYRPLFLVWFRLMYSAVGTFVAGWHLFSIVSNLAVVWLVFKLMRRVTDDEDIAGLTALFFVLHPVHIETVAWISAMSESLYAIPALLALLVYFRYMENRQLSNLLGAAGLFALALFTKETALTLIGVFAGCEYLYRKGGRTEKFRKVLLGLVPFVVISGFYLLVRAYALRSFTHFPQPHSWSEVLLTIPAAFWFYLRLLFWPFGTHSQFYDLSLVSAPTWLGFWAPLVASAVALAALSYWARRSKLGGFALLWLIFPMIPPLLGIYTFRDHDLVHDRYLYLPALCVCILLATGLKFWMVRAQASQQPVLKALPVMATLAIAGFFVTRDLREQYFYKNDIHLYEQAVKTAPNKAMVWNFLGYAYGQDGRSQAAIGAHRRALELNTKNWETHAYLGNLLFVGGELEDAAAHMQKAAELRPGPDRSHILYKLGLTFARMSRFLEAEQSFRKALELAPTRPTYHYSLGQSLRKQGRLQEAAAEFEREIALNNDEHSKQALATMEAEKKPGR
ncbi:MAG TPA: tetratricopeptide repeat protein [Terriglobales bacterium]|nr:tetratricopeptide repeat protein [Terriglobales bacterium]